MSKASLELGGGNWAAKDGNILGYAVGDTSGKYLPREFDFSRGADIAATRINKNGLVEKYRENALINSGDFSIVGASGGWVKNASTVTSGYAGYDGTTNAWKLESNTGTSYNNLNQQAQYNAAITPLGSKVSTFSVYLKAGTTNWARLNLNNTGYVYFDLENGEIGTVSSVWVSGQIESAGNGFYRCSITRLTGNAFDACYIYLAESDENLFPNTHSTPKHVFVQHPQLEYGLVATDYLESGGSTSKAGVLDNLPRIDYTSGNAQLLMEPSRTNLVNQSEYFGGYLTSSATVTQNALVSPEGLQNASTINITSNAGSIYAQSGTAVDSVVASTTYTFSFYVKQGTNTENYLAVRDQNAEVFIDTDVAYTASSSEWTRVEHTFTTPAGCTSIRLYPQRYSSGGQGTTHIWGMQLEAGSYATSYIPTYGASDTRDYDQAAFDYDAAADAWTVYMDVSNMNVQGDPSDQGHMKFKGQDNNTVDALFFFGTCFGYKTTDISAPAYPNKYICSALGVSGTVFSGKWAVTYDGANTMKVYVNGSLYSTKTDVDPTPTRGIQSFQLQYNSSSSKTRRSIKEFKIYNKELSQTEAEALTS
jgi:hypothetical protein